MMKNTALLALPALALSACASLPAPEAASSPPYMALGTEPFWNLEITPEQLNFNGLDLPRVAVRNPGMRESGGMRTIRAGRIVVTLRAGACSDGMSDYVYADNATVVVDGRSFSGCGGMVTTRSAGLERSSWQITHVNGRPAATGVTTEINFADGRMSGTAGCNRLSGSYTQERASLRFGPMAMTRMACMGPGGDQEDVVVAILNQPLTIRFGERMTMVWSAPDGSTIALRRLDWD